MNMNVELNEYIEPKSVTTASTDNNAKRSARNDFFQQKCEEVMNRL